MELSVWLQLLHRLQSLQMYRFQDKKHVFQILQYTNLGNTPKKIGRSS